MNSGATVAFEQIGRCFFPAGDAGLRAYVRENFAVPHRTIDRFVGWLPQQLERFFTGKAVAPRWTLTQAGTIVQVPPEANTHDVRRLERALAMWRHAIEGGATVGASSRRAPLDGRTILVLDYEDAIRQQLMGVMFSGNGRTPAAIVKVRPAGPAAERLQQERQALQHAVAFSDGLRHSIPRGLAWFEDGTLTALTLSGLRGHSAYGQMHASVIPAGRVRSHLKAAVDWLLAMQAATRRPELCDLDEECDLARQVYGDESWAAAFVCDEIAQLASTADPRGLRIVRSHGDFWARNLLLNGSNAASGVVDWEQCQAGAPAFNDMFHFVVTYGLAFRWPGRPSAEAAFHRTFFERNWVSTMVKRSLARYCLRSGLTLAALPAALAVYLARQHRAARTSPDMRPTGDQDVWIRCLKVLATAERSAFYGSSIP